MRLHILVNCCIARDIKADVDVDDNHGIDSRRGSRSADPRSDEILPGSGHDI